MNPSVQFTQERLARLAEIERWHFWFVGRRVLVNRLLDRYQVSSGQGVLDLGCGTGFTLQTLQQRGCRAFGLDMRPEGLASLRGTVVQGDATRLPFDSDSFDAVLMQDVVEHVDDGALLAEVRRCLRPGGIAIMTVPALPGLWSYRDEAAGHLRRYTRSSLTERINAAQMRVQEMVYYQFLLLPLVVISRVFGRRGPALRDAEDQPHRIVNSLFRRVNTIEARLGATVRWPLGSSIAAVCRKG